MEFTPRALGGAQSCVAIGRFYRHNSLAFSSSNHHPPLLHPPTQLTSMSSVPIHGPRTAGKASRKAPPKAIKYYPVTARILAPPTQCNDACNDKMTIMCDAFRCTNTLDSGVSYVNFGNNPLDPGNKNQCWVCPSCVFAAIKGKRKVSVADYIDGAPKNFLACLRDAKDYVRKDGNISHEDCTRYCDTCDRLSIETKMDIKKPCGYDIIADDFQVTTDIRPEINQLIPGVDGDTHVITSIIYEFYKYNEDTKRATVKVRCRKASIDELYQDYSTCERAILEDERVKKFALAIDGPDKVSEFRHLLEQAAHCLDGIGVNTPKDLEREYMLVDAYYRKEKLEENSNKLPIYAERINRRHAYYHETKCHLDDAVLTFAHAIEDAIENK